MLDLLHCWRALGGGIYAADDGHGPILLGAAAGDILASEVRVGFSGGIDGIPSPGTARKGEPPSLEDTNRHTGSQAI